MLVSAEWCVPASPMHDEGGSSKKYPLAVSPIDDLVADVFRASSWIAASVSFLRSTNPAAQEAITRRNKQADFVTKRSSQDMRTTSERTA
jgi:hypothetical protein